MLTVFGLLVLGVMGFVCAFFFSPFLTVLVNKDLFSFIAGFSILLVLGFFLPGAIAFFTTPWILIWPLTFTLGFIISGIFEESRESRTFTQQNLNNFDLNGVS